MEQKWELIWKMKKLRKKKVKTRITYNENLRIKINQVDIDNFPIETLEVSIFWKSLYEGS